jgi:hypothetical protein
VTSDSRLCRGHKIVHSRGRRLALTGRLAPAPAFSLIDALILRPLPVEDAQSLIYVALRAPADSRDGLSFNGMRRRPDNFSWLAHLFDRLKPSALSALFGPLFSAVGQRRYAIRAPQPCQND